MAAASAIPQRKASCGIGGPINIVARYVPSFGPMAAAQLGTGAAIESPDICAHLFGLAVGFAERRLEQVAD